MRGDSVRGEGLSEYRYEAAWRCTQWEEGACLVTPSTSPSGDYHQTLYGCFTALKDEETDLLKSSISEARYACSMDAWLKNIAASA